MGREKFPKHQAKHCHCSEKDGISEDTVFPKREASRCGNGNHCSRKASELALMAGILFVLFIAMPVSAALTIPGADDSDGILHIVQDTVIDLSLAEEGAWDADNSANAGNGIYDSGKWAVVFKYQSVTVDEGVTLSFSNHPSRAPVVWLVSGDATISGTLSLNGQNYQSAPTNPEPGPGGFRGGTGTYASGVSAGAGLGPGGGGFQYDLGYAGSYGTVGGSGPARYGNQSLIPLIGGSGGGADPQGNIGGGAGGGVILIACQNTLTVNGLIRANGGAGYDGYPQDTAGGSGGGIRLVSDTLSGTGTITALGGGGYKAGGLGRIRIERVVNDNTLQVTPDASLLALTEESTPIIWPPDGAPTVRIVSIGGESAPDDPLASFGTTGADVVLPEVSTTQVLIETENVEEASQVQVRVTPRFNSTYTLVDATVDTIVSSDPLIIHWVADLPVNVGYSAVQVKVVRP